MSATARILPFSPPDRSLPSAASPVPGALTGRGHHADPLRRYAPALRRWLRGRMPVTDHPHLTLENVERAVFDAVGRLEAYEGGYAIAIQAAFRQAVLDRIRDTGQDDAQASPLERIIGRRGLARYEHALHTLPAADRAAIVARLEMGFSYGEVARMLGSPSPQAARAIVTQAVVRLAEGMRDAG